MDGLPKTREQACQEGSKAYFTGLPCKHGHIAKRWTATGNCSTCQRNRTNSWQINNPEKYLAYRNSDARKKSSNESVKRYYAKNKEYYSNKNAKRRADKLQATTVWGQEGVEDFYKKAKELEKMNPTVKFHVDHIVPLVGKNVCGLHNRFNLQVLTELQNKRKGKAWN